MKFMIAKETFSLATKKSKLNQFVIWVAIISNSMKSMLRKVFMVYRILRHNPQKFHGKFR